MSILLRLSLCATWPLALFCSSPVTAACQAGPFAIALPEQRLDERLQDLAHRTGCFVAVEPALLEGKRAPALDGLLTSEQAFLQSVRGRGLETGPSQGHWRIDRAQQIQFAARIALLRARLADAAHGTAITPKAAGTLDRELDAIAVDVPAQVRAQGFLSAAERASYGKRLDAVERSLSP